MNGPIPPNEVSGRSGAISILIDVIGPVMRGPSSSHTAGSYHIGRLVSALLGTPARVCVAFDPAGSYGQVYRERGVDRGFAMRLLGIPLTMTPEMVAEAARAFRPKILYPYHFVGTDTSLLVNLLKDEKGTEVRIRDMR